MLYIFFITLIMLLY